MTIAATLLVLTVLVALGLLLIGPIRRKVLEFEVLKELIVAVVVTVIVAIVAFGVEHLGVDIKAIAKILGAGAIGTLVFILQRIERLEETTRTMLRFEVRDNLVRTNAAIPYNRRIALTAQVIDFPPETEYAMESDGSERTDTIDVLRQFEYQNYVFTPAYFNFLFYRRAKSKSARKVIVVAEPSQAALVFVNLCARIGYRTIVMSATRFREFVDKHCGGRQGKQLLPMIKGNPSVARVESGSSVVFSGKYTDRKKARGMGIGEHVSFATEEAWNLLVKLTEAGRDVTAAVESGRLVDVEVLRIMLDENEKDQLPQVAPA